MHASEPSLKACKLTFAGETTQLGEVFRNQSLTRCMIMSRKDFESLTLSFTSELDPITKNPINLNFTSSHFDKVESTGLFQLAAKAKITKNIDKVALSKKYQVLCDQTAFVGVIKQKDKTTGQMIDYFIEFGQNVVSKQKQKFSTSKSYRDLEN